MGGGDVADSTLDAIFKCLKMVPVPPCCNSVAIADEDAQLLAGMEGNPYVAGMSDLRPNLYGTKERIGGTIYCKMREQI